MVCTACGKKHFRKTSGRSKWPRPWICECGNINLTLTPLPGGDGWLPHDLEGYIIAFAAKYARIAFPDYHLYLDDIKQEALLALYTLLAATGDPSSLPDEYRSGWLRILQSFTHHRIREFFRLMGYGRRRGDKYYTKKEVPLAQHLHP